MYAEVLYFLSRQHLAAVTIQLSDNTLYPSIMHVACGENPFRLFFLTTKASKKMTAVSDHAVCSAGVVLGFNEEEYTTLQMTGSIREVSEKEKKEVKEIYLLKYPWKKSFSEKKESIFIEFLPSWWRYTDYATHPQTIYSFPTV